jgi:putative flippase GtrA
MRSLKHSTLVRFLLVGGLSYLVNQALLMALYDGAFVSMPRGHAFNAPLLLASMLALEVSILVRFALNDAWTFRDRRSKSFLARFWQSNFTSFGSPLISLAAVNVLTPFFGISYLVSNSLGILLGVAWNWFSSVAFVWKAGERAASQTERSFIRLDRTRIRAGRPATLTAVWKPYRPETYARPRLHPSFTPPRRNSRPVHNVRL